MISNYYHPQLRIRQVLQQIPQVSAQVLSAFVLGPQYALSRFTNPDEKAKMEGVPFNAELLPQLIPYENQDPTQVVDPSYVKLYGQQLEAQIWRFQPPSQDPSVPFRFRIKSLSEPTTLSATVQPTLVTVTVGSSTPPTISAVTLLDSNGGFPVNTVYDMMLLTPVDTATQQPINPGSGAAVRFTTDENGYAINVELISPGSGYTVGSFTASFRPPYASVNLSDNSPTATQPLAPELLGRPIQVGDVIYSTPDILGPSTSRLKVLGFDYSPTASSFGSDVAISNQHLAGVPSNPAASTAAFTSGSLPAGWSLVLSDSCCCFANVTDSKVETARPTFSVSEPIAITNGTPWGTIQATASGTLDSNNKLNTVSIVTKGAGYYYRSLVGVIISAPGSGYSTTTPPTLSVTLTSPASWTSDYRLPVLAPILVNGALVDVEILEAGYNLPNGTALTCTVTATTGSGATFLAVVNVGSIRSISINTPGVYTPTVTPQTVTVAAPPSGITAAGVLSFYRAVSVTLTNGGHGYPALVSGVTSTIKLSSGFLVRINTVVGGVVTSVSLLGPGSVSPLGSLATPTVAAASIGAQSDTNSMVAGQTPASVTLTWGVGAVRMTNPGTGYDLASPPTVTPPSGTTAATLLVSTIGTNRDLVTLPTIVGKVSGVVMNSKAELVTVSRAKDWSGLTTGASLNNGQTYGDTYNLRMVNATTVALSMSSGTFKPTTFGLKQGGRGYFFWAASLGGVAVELRPPSPSTPVTTGMQFAYTVVGDYKPLQTAVSSVISKVGITNPGSGLLVGSFQLNISPSSTDLLTVIIVSQSGSGVDDGYVGTVALTRVGAAYKYAPVVTVPTNVLTGGVNPVAPIFTVTLTSPETTGDLVLTSGSVYTGTKKTRYQIKVVAGAMISPTDPLATMPYPGPSGSIYGATLEVSDTAGSEATQIYTGVSPGQAPYPLGTQGLSFYLPISTGTDSGLNNGVTATATTTVVAGVITGATLTGPGSGYPDGPVVVHVYSAVAPTTPATVTATALGGHVVGPLTVAGGGTGYTGNVYLVFDPPPMHQRGLRQGNVYYVDAIPAGPGTVPNQIKLNGQAADVSAWNTTMATETNFDVRSTIVAPTSEIPALANGRVVWTADASGVTLQPGATIHIPGRTDLVPIVNSSNGLLFTSSRSMVIPAQPNTIKLYTSEKSIQADFGLFDMDNPVCYGAIMAFRGAQGNAVWVAKVASDDLPGYQAVLTQAERTDGIYAIAPMSYDFDVQQAVSAHVTLCSGETRKRWRRGYVATASPGAYTIVKLNSLQSQYLGQVLPFSTSSNRRVVCSVPPNPEGPFVLSGVLPGDIYRTNYSADAVGVETYESYEVQTVLSDTELLLKTGPAQPVAAAQRFEIWRPDNGPSQSSWVQKRSEAFENRRICNVWVDRPYTTDPKTGAVLFVPVYYVAAEIAGLRSAVLPQQGLTYTEIRQSIQQAPLMFTKYTDDDLDVAASGGTFIVTQEVLNGPLFIRHQLTTDANDTDGILFWEDSVGTNLDNISYLARALFQPYIGRRNANREVLEELETKFRDILNQLLLAPANGSNIGPALITWTNLILGIDPVMKDKINVQVGLQLPLPINVIDVTLYATAAQEDITIVVTNTDNTATPA